MSEILSAMEYIHLQGYVYSDLKPENILMDHSGHLKICDFGVSSIYEPNKVVYTRSGTWSYFSPEIIQVFILIYFFYRKKNVMEKVSIGGHLAV